MKVVNITGDRTAHKTPSRIVNNLELLRRGLLRNLGLRRRCLLRSLGRFLRRRHRSKKQVVNLNKPARKHDNNRPTKSGYNMYNLCTNLGIPQKERWGEIGATTMRTILTLPPYDIL